MKKAIVVLSVTAVPLVFILGAWWLGGFDFDKRGPAAFLCFATTSLVCGCVAWMASQIYEKSQ